MLRDTELYDQSRLYKCRHWLRDGGWEFLCSRLVVGTTCCVVGVASFAWMAVIYLKSISEEPQFTKQVPHVIDTKRFRTNRQYEVMEKK